MAAGRKALVVATYTYADGGLSKLAAPAHDAESFASVLEDPAIAGFDVTMLVNKAHYEVGEAIADFYGGAHRDDLTLLYFTGHGVKDDEGRLYLAMTNTRREALMFTAISAAQLNDAMDASTSRRKVLILDCCYSGAFPAGRTAKSDEGVQTLERFQGKGRAVLTASDATQYAFEGDNLRGSGTSSIFTRHLVEAIRSGAADLDEDGDIALDELYSYVYEQVVAEMPQQRPKKQEDVDGRILIARNVHWTLPAYLQHAIESPIAGQRLNALQELEHLHVVGNAVVRAAVDEQVHALAADDSRSVSAAASALLERLRRPGAGESVPDVVVEQEVAPASSAPDVVAGQEVAPASSAPDVVVDQKAVPASSAPVSSVRPPVPAAAEPPPSRPAPTEPPPREPAAPEPPPIEAVPADLGFSAKFPATPVLALVAATAALLTLSRLFPFDVDSSYYARDLGYPTLPWVLGVVVPLVAATQLVLLRGTRDGRALIAVGLIGGVTLIQVEQVLSTTTLAADPDASFKLGGPGWWLAVLGTVVLLACLVVAGRRGVLRAVPRVVGTWRTLLGVVLVGGALFGWLSAFGDFYLWWPANIGGLLMAAVALPVVVLGLNRAQRTVALVAVSVAGAFIAISTGYSLLTQTYFSDAGRGVAVMISALVSVLACYVAQARLPRPSSDRPEAGAAPRR